jgi:Zn-dependent protease
MGGRSIQLARIFGIRIGASPSWFVVLLLMIVWLSQGYDGRYGQTTGYVVAVASAVAFFASLILHELGHALAARRSGIGIAGIDLWLFGGIAKLTRDSTTPGEELRIAGAGPLVTLAIVLACVGAGVAIGGQTGFADAVALTGDPSPGLALLGWLALVNAFLLVFNMVPAFPLDGGRIARAIAWRVTGDRNRGTRFSARLGQAFSYVLIAIGIFEAVRGDVFSGVWLAVLGWFLGQAATGAVASSRFSERLAGVTAQDLMDTEPVWVPADLTVRQAQEDFFDRWGQPWFPVADPHSGRFIGLVRAPALQAALAAGRPESPITDIVDATADATLEVSADTPVEELLASDGLRAQGALMVVDAQHSLRGVVTLDQVRRALTATATGGRLA